MQSYFPADSDLKEAKEHLEKAKAALRDYLAALFPKGVEVEFAYEDGEVVEWSADHPWNPDPLGESEKDRLEKLLAEVAEAVIELDALHPASQLAWSVRGERMKGINALVSLLPPGEGAVEPQLTLRVDSWVLGDSDGCEWVEDGGEC